MGGILFLVFGAMGAGFFFIFLLALADKKKRAKAGEGRGANRLDQEQFEKACVAVVEGMRLEIDEIHRSIPSRLDMIARNPTPIVGGRFLIHCLYADPAEIVTSAQIIEFSNMVLQERLSKGILMTTGSFTQEIPAIGELAPIEFIDGPALEGLMEKYRVRPSSSFCRSPLSSLPGSGGR